jgi:hypothetical protein
VVELMQESGVDDDDVAGAMQLACRLNDPD